MEEEGGRESQRERERERAEERQVRGPRGKGKKRDKLEKGGML